MLFAIGTKVRFKHSGDIGKVTEQLDDHMVNVHLLEDDMIIPAFIEDLELIDTPTSGKAKIVPGKQVKKLPKIPDIKAPDIQYKILNSKGIQIAFDPVYRADGSPAEYQMLLINDTRSDWLFTFGLSLRESLRQQKNGKLAAFSYQSVGTLLFDQLNDAPIIDIDCWQISTQGTGAKQHKTLKIKAKSFFNKQQTAPLLNRKAHLYLLIPATTTQETSTNARDEDIHTYTKRKTTIQKEEDRYNPFHEVIALAEFEPEIDLHIEELVENPKKIKANEILRIQLQHFEEYMDRAIRLGVPRVFIIHGLGTGKLRGAIAAKLRHMPEVKTFKNEYHARYGYGATEVVFE